MEQKKQRHWRMRGRKRFLQEKLRIADAARTHKDANDTKVADTTEKK